MQLLLITLLFLLGLIFGSFFNVVGLRLPKKEAFTNDRSICPSCKHTLSWFELIPILSFAIQYGKCRHCKREISFIYPIVECITGLLFMISYLIIGLEMELIIALCLVSMLMIVLVSDLSYMVIPNKVLLFFLPIFVIMRFIEPLDPWWSPIVGALIGYGIVAIIILVSQGGMGAGDMKLFGVLGIALGIQNVLLAFLLACIIGAVIGMGLLTLKIIDRKQALPFGPYIIAATLITYFYGEPITSWYFNYFI